MVLLAALLPAAGARAAWPVPPRSMVRAIEVDRQAAAKAETHFALGHRLYQLGRYDEAIAELRRGYEVRPEPRFLREIADSYQELGANDQALFYYDRYLSVAPEAPDRGEVEGRASDLEALLAPPPPPNGSRRPLLILEPPPKAPPRHLWQRWWFWTAVGVSVAAGVTAALFVAHSEPPPPMTALGDRTFY